MRVRNHRVPALGLLLLAACSRPPAPGAAAGAPAAKVQAPVTEADLAKVTLSADAERRLGIETVMVQRRAVVRTRAVGGEVIVPPGARTVVAAPVAGVLATPAGAASPGAVVVQGQPIFRLVPLGPAERDASIDADRAVAEAQSRHELLTRRLQRAETVAREGAGSRRAVEEAQAELAIAAADLKAARERVAAAGRGHATPSGIDLSAPFSGLLLDVHAGAGQTVAAGAPLFDLARLDPVWVRAPVFVGEAAEIDVRAGARIVGLGEPAGAAGLPAAAVTAPPSADPSTATVDLYFSLGNAGHRFRPGQRVGVRLTQRGAVESLVVPRGALLYDAHGGTWVYEAAGGHVYVRRRVAVADLVGADAVLERGAAAGMRVVTAGAAELFGTEFGAGK